MLSKKNINNPKSHPSKKTPTSRRVDLIKRIEELRGTTVITYLTSTRPGLEVQMGLDVIRYVYNHLKEIKKHKKNKPKIDLFIHSNGGDGTVPWRLVTLIREFTDSFGVLVPHRAFSAATLTALGANEIIMHSMGMLGPTDATVANSFNPVDPDTKKRMGISVEDVTAYLQLIKDDAGIQHEDELVQAFNLLAEKVHPLALGNVKRSMSQSRMMASKLLGLHMDQNKQSHRIQEIVDSLTSKLFYHGHPINRKEAREQIGLESVQNVSEEIEEAIWDLYLEYETELKLLENFDVAMEFAAAYPHLDVNAIQTTELTTAKMIYVESAYDCDVYNFEYQITGTKQADGKTNMVMTTKKRGWTKET